MHQEPEVGQGLLLDLNFMPCADLKNSTQGHHFFGSMCASTALIMDGRSLVLIAGLITQCQETTHVGKRDPRLSVS